MAVYLFQAHGARPEFSDDSLEFMEEGFQPGGQIVALAAWQANHAGFDQLDPIGPVFDHAVAGQIEARINADDAAFRPCHPAGL